MGCFSEPYTIRLVSSAGRVHDDARYCITMHVRTGGTSLSVTAPKGFRAAAVTTAALGARGTAGPADLVLLVNDGPDATAAGSVPPGLADPPAAVWTRRALRAGIVRAVVLPLGDPAVTRAVRSGAAPLSARDIHSLADRTAAGLTAAGVAGWSSVRPTSSSGRPAKAVRVPVRCCSPVWPGRYARCTAPVDATWRQPSPQPLRRTPQWSQARHCPQWSRAPGGRSGPCSVAGRLSRRRVSRPGRTPGSNRGWSCSPPMRWPTRPCCGMPWQRGGPGRDHTVLLLASGASGRSADRDELRRRGGRSLAPARPTPLHSGGPVTAPASRALRHARIVALIAARPVHSQAELGDLLAGEGIAITQATLSRDLEELGAVKLRGADGGAARYVVPVEGPGVAGGAGPGSARLRRLLRDLLTGADASGNLVVLRTPPGAAQFLAGALRPVRAAEIVGPIAGTTRFWSWPGRR